MKIAIAVLILIAAGAGGYFLRSTCEGEPEAGPPKAAVKDEADAEAALEELLRYTGQGSGAGRYVIELVDRVSAGGPGVLPALERAIEKSPPWSYGVNRSIANRPGVYSSLPTRWIALLEAVTRIGGAEAIEMLIHAANDPGPGSALDKMAPILFLARHANEARVREFFTERTRLWVRTMRNDSVMNQFLKVVRGRLIPDVEPYLSGALALGWPQSGVAEGIAHCLYEIDASGARATFFSILMDPKKAKPARKAAAWALGRLPEARADALARIMGELSDADLLQRLITGIGRNRFDEADRYYAAIGSDDPDAFRTYFEGRRREIAACRELFDAVEAKLGSPAAAKYGIPTRRDNFKRVIEDYEKKQKLIDAAKR